MRKQGLFILCDRNLLGKKNFHMELLVMEQGLLAPVASTGGYTSKLINFH